MRSWGSNGGPGALLEPVRTNQGRHQGPIVVALGGGMGGNRAVTIRAVVALGVELVGGVTLHRFAQAAGLHGAVDVVTSPIFEIQENPLS